MRSHVQKCGMFRQSSAGSHIFRQSSAIFGNVMIWNRNILSMITFGKRRQSSATLWYETGTFPIYNSVRQTSAIVGNLRQPYDIKLEHLIYDHFTFHEDILDRLVVSEQLKDFMVEHLVSRVNFQAALRRTSAEKRKQSQKKMKTVSLEHNADKENKDINILKS